MAEYRQHATYKLKAGDDGSVIGPRGKPLKLALPPNRYGERPWARYGITNAMYRLIRSGKNWSHVS